MICWSCILCSCYNVTISIILVPVIIAIDNFFLVNVIIELNVSFLIVFLPFSLHCFLACCTVWLIDLLAIFPFISYVLPVPPCSPILLLERKCEAILLGLWQSLDFIHSGKKIKKYVHWFKWLCEMPILVITQAT